MSVTIFSERYLNNLTVKPATLELLTCSILVSLSGAFRIYLASILLGTQVSILTCAAGFLIIYSVYTLDRVLDSQEDLINKSELAGSNKHVGLTAVIVTFLIGSIVFVNEGLLIYAFIPFVTGFLYTRGLKLGKYSLRLKGGLGIKNSVVGLTWGIFITGIAANGNILSMAAVFILYGVKVFINSIIDDFKDIEGDTQANIKTLPIWFGEQKTRIILVGLHIISHVILVIALLKGVVAFEPIIILCSFLCGSICILKYTKEFNNTGLTVFKDGESPMSFILIAALSLILA